MRRSISAISLVVAASLTLAACGGDTDDALAGSDRERASAAALEYVGAGTVTDAEAGESDDPFAYEVEVTLPNGTDIDVELDEDFAVTNSPAKASDFESDSAPTDEPQPSDTPSQTTDDNDADDRELTGDTRKKAVAAALKATGGGRVTETSGSDDPDHVYEVEVDFSNGEDATVELDEDFKVVRIDR